jgi:hypothetical protein
MAKELQFWGNPDTQSGYIVTLNIFNSNGNLVTSGINVPEVSGSAIYITDMPSLPKDRYIIRFFGFNTYLAAGEINWDGTKEIDPLDDMIREVWELHGLDISMPLTVTQTSRTFGEVIQSIDTSGENQSQETIVTRI